MAHTNGHKFVICIRNDDYPASLETRKLYEVLPDAEAERHHQVRVIDESGDDYLYPEEYFMSVQLSVAAEKALVNAP